MDQDRRLSPRIPLDTPCLLTLVVGQDRYPAMLVDISAGGLHLMLPPHLDELTFPVETEVSLGDLPEGLAQLMLDSTGKIAWTASRHCGIRLNTQIKATVEDLLAAVPL